MGLLGQLSIQALGGSGLDTEVEFQTDLNFWMKTYLLKAIYRSQKSEFLEESLNLPKDKSRVGSALTVIIAKAHAGDDTEGATSRFFGSCKRGFKTPKT